MWGQDEMLDSEMLARVVGTLSSRSQIGEIGGPTQCDGE